MKRAIKALLVLVLLLVMGVAGVAGAGLWAFYRYGQDLPDHQQLANYVPDVMTRVHAGNGQLLAEYAVERRVFVPREAIPAPLIHAFLSAEDKTFYDHPGIDPPGILYAVLINLQNLGSNRRPVGASTITQQVAKNFLLTNEVSIIRKIKEAILAIRMERAFSKDAILELYLNEIYLGRGSYGVAAAALNYFDKSLNELSLADVAFLAALPKAPNNYDPVRFPEAALARRDWVLGRMLDDGRITPAEAAEAKLQPIALRERPLTEFVNAQYFTEEVRQELAERYGETALYRGGLLARTTLDPALQEISRRALRQGLEAYDRRHGWRGPITKLTETDNLPRALERVTEPKGLAPWQLAVVTAVTADDVRIALRDGGTGRIPFAAMAWARPWQEDQKVGDKPAHPKDVLAVGDVVPVAPWQPTDDDQDAAADENKASEARAGDYALKQIPDIEGAVVALDPHTGRVLAMVGGYDYEKSQFNRAVQAKRQPGSAFKPFVYLAALDAGYTPSTLILDAPFVIDQGPGLPKWRPENYTTKFYGPSTMRLGIEKSRNLMTVRMAQAVGMDKISGYAKAMGVVDDMPNQLSMALGAGETTLLRLTTAYAMLVNGGKRITPTLLDRVQDRHGKTIYLHDQRVCPDCRRIRWQGQPPPRLPDTREQVADPATAYQVVSMLQGVVERGTGISIASLNKTLAGKTGTTNDSIDTWFVGFSPDLALGVFVGFDEPRSLGKREQGASAAAPVFRQIMAEALADVPNIPFRIPPGIRLVRVNAKTGQVAQAGDRNVILEAFKPGTIPTGEVRVISGSAGLGTASSADDVPPATSSSGGLDSGFY